MFIPLWLLILALVSMAAFVAWAIALARGRNPLPFPDHGSRIFAAPTAQAKAAIVDLLAMHGLHERFRMDTGGVSRSILWDGTIINCSSPEVTAKLDGVAACIGLVASDPAASGHAAAAFLRERGFSARVVLDAEPELPIAFVLTDAMTGTALNFRKHVVRLPRPDSPPARR